MARERPVGPPPPAHPRLGGSTTNISPEPRANTRPPPRQRRDNHLMRYQQLMSARVVPKALFRSRSGWVRLPDHRARERKNQPRRTARTRPGAMSSAVSSPEQHATQYTAPDRNIPLDENVSQSGPTPGHRPPDRQVPSVSQTDPRIRSGGVTENRRPVQCAHESNQATTFLKRLPKVEVVGLSEDWQHASTAPAIGLTREVT